MDHTNDRNTYKGSILIILAGIFWGSMAIFVRKLTEYGYSASQIVCLRMTVAAIVFVLILLIMNPSGFHIKFRDIPLFLGLGIMSLLFFTTCYFTAIRILPVSTAAILLYTSPVWVMLMSIIFLKEKVTKFKMIGLVLSVAGCICVSGIGSGSVSVAGILIGIGSGIGYGLYSIFGSLALRKYSPQVVTAYAFLVAAIGSLCINNPVKMIQSVISDQNSVALIFLIIVTGLVTAVIPFGCYTAGLKSVEASKAAILATVEPMVATLIGIIIYHEQLTLISALGVVCILAAVVVLSRKDSNSN